MEADDMTQHINKFTEIADKLSEIGIEMQEELLSIILLSSQPQNFENFVIVMETRDSLPSLNVLKQKLLEEGERRKNEKDNNAQHALCYRYASQERKS